MKKKYLIIITSVLVIIAIGSAFVLLKNKDPLKISNSPQSTQTIDENNLPFFIPEEEFIITATTKQADNSTTKAVITVQDSDTYQIEVEDESIVIVDNGSLYNQQNGVFVKLPLNLSNQTTVNQFAAYTNSAKYVHLSERTKKTGSQPCGAGICETYEVTDLDGLKTELKINDGRVVEIVGPVQEDGSQTTVAYDYNTAVNVTVPTEFEEFEIPSINELDQNQP